MIQQWEYCRADCWWPPLFDRGVPDLAGCNSDLLTLRFKSSQLFSLSPASGLHVLKGSSTANRVLVCTASPLSNVGRAACAGLIAGWRGCPFFSPSRGDCTCMGEGMKKLEGVVSQGWHVSLKCTC